MEYPTLETLSTRRHYHRRIPLKKDVGFRSMLLLLVLVLVLVLVLSIAVLVLDSI
jgi:hypothetical protein